MTAATASASSSSVLDELCSAYLPFDASSSVWSDVKPTPATESSSPMCPILYHPEYSQAMDLYRTLTSSNTSPLSSSLSKLELSPRALALTSHLIQLNPSHFSIWQFRANILLYSDELEKVQGGREGVLKAELRWLDGLAHAHMKSYQVWQHRRLVVAALAVPDGELEFVAQNLAKDAKNYHTWGYRQWLLAHFGGLQLALPIESTIKPERSAATGAACFPQLWNGELEYIDSLLLQDIRNNSAWNHRWFVNFSRLGLTGNMNPSCLSSVSLATPLIESVRKTIKFEMAYTKASLSHVPNNASAWNYLRALHTAFPPRLQTRLSETLAWVQTLVSSHAEVLKDPSVDIMGRSPVGALEWWLDCIAEPTDDTAMVVSKSKLDEAEILVRRLMVADSVRKRYYAYRLKTIRRNLNTA